MRCPICGSKLFDDKICKYCKITKEQILNSSNKKVIKYRKSGNSDLVYYTNVIPSDVNRLKLILYTIFLGLLGVNYFYINRPVRASFSLVVTIFSFVFSFIFLYVSNSSVINVINQIFLFFLTFNVIFWIFDIINVFLKRIKIPVVLADKEDK